MNKNINNVVLEVLEDIMEKQIVKEWEHLNKQKPIWTRQKEDITEEEYKTFYSSISKDHDEMLHYNHFTAEGQIEFDSLLFIPNRPPFDLFDSHQKKTNIKLYVKRVFIMDDCKEIIPEWLSFVKGIVDCKDLPLNVSREILQQSKVLKIIKKQITKKAIQMMLDISKNDEKYNSFYDGFHKNIKLGIHEDSGNRPKLTKLLRYNSVNHKNEQISLEKYISEMKDDQKDIYYIGGESVKSVENSLFLEKFKAKGYDVLFFTDPIDEYVTQQFKTFEEKNLVSVSSKDLQLDSADDKQQKETQEEFEDLCKKMKEILGEKVSDVVTSNRVVDSPCCLVTDSYGYSANMQRIMKAQALNNNPMMEFMFARKQMELNPQSSIIVEINNKFKADSSDPLVVDVTHMLYELSLLTSGFTLDDPSTFAKRFNRMLKLGLTGDGDADITESTEEVDNSENETNMEAVD